MDHRPNIQKIKSALPQVYDEKLISIEKVSGGLVHYVYQVETKKRIFFVKIRSDHYSEIKNIPTNPDLIKHEYKALQIFSQVAPDIFPTVIKFFPEEHMLFLSDVMPYRKTLEEELNKSKATPKNIKALGELIANIHSKLASVNEQQIREDRDVEYYTQLHYYRFGYHNHKILTTLVEQLNDQPKQLIIGDLSPKNIGVSPKGTFNICDLENAHYGNTLSDVGFLACSIILHTIHDNKLAYTLLTSFLQGYSSVIPYNDNEEMLIKKIILGVALYRLANPVIPYELAITESQRSQIIKEINDTLFDENISWEHIVKAITV